MLTTIREKAQGTFAKGMLVAICGTFALWGIQNYMNNGSEPPVVSVGDKDFYQRDVNKAYEKYSQNLQGMNIDEQALKKQALDKLIKDEVLLQYVHDEGLAVTDDSVRNFIKTLPYFQTNGKFDDKQYKKLLSSQKMSSAQFVGEIKNALLMEQFQRSITDSSFATQYDVESFFKIHNQQRDVAYVSVAPQKLTEQPSDEEITKYYQQHVEAYKIPEQISVEYLELTSDDMAKTIVVTDDKLKAFYDEQIDQYTTPERRKISHILFAINSKQDEKTALDKAIKAQEALKTKDFAALTTEVSDDKKSGKEGGDLGFFNAGDLEKSIEDAAKALKKGEVSKPVKSAFGYHLIKVTELEPAVVKPYDSIKADVTKAYQKAQSEDAFFKAGETLTEVSYQNPDSLQAAADALKLTIKKSALFTKDKGDGIAADEKIRIMAFSEEVLQGNNSTPIEISADRVAVLRKLEHRPSATRELKDIKTDVITAILNDKSKQQATEKAQKIKERLLAGESIDAIAAENKLAIQKLPGFTRTTTAVPEPVSQAIFKAAKPAVGKATATTVTLPTGENIVISITKITDGVMSAEDKKKLDLATKNIAKAVGQNEFEAVLGSLQADTDVSIATPKVTAP
ncbi:PpiC-type peptidyl-prolyl cis-trans isomerase [Crenothrix polyspora]|uniref:Periplasmic chaperone PpiD n=1 Tax=Crenothrix polyspora TaxID=360316 RepID=A0A1R4HIC7_9GAMM|nr:SurA N-terminal domain-containing protein [Crenothrix polyspora]SJM95949.1 PpiC-type peptidyl-prolyl cis-trans isomerase [Crenothrix polyspora]